MWQSVHWLLPRLLDFTILSFSSLRLGPVSAPQHASVCVWNTESWIGVCSIGLLNAYVFTVSAPQMPLFFPVWERFCDLRLPNVACFVLPASPFQWSWHCYGVHVLYCWPHSFLAWTWSPALLLKHCACDALCRKKTVLPVCRQMEFGI